VHRKKNFRIPLPKPDRANQFPKHGHKKKKETVAEFPKHGHKKKRETVADVRTCQLT
jgi:hypothetical protein